MEAPFGAHRPSRLQPPASAGRHPRHRRFPGPRGHRPGRVGRRRATPRAAGSPSAWATAGRSPPPCWATRHADPGRAGQRPGPGRNLWIRNLLKVWPPKGRPWSALSPVIEMILTRQGRRPHRPAGDDQSAATHRKEGRGPNSSWPRWAAHRQRDRRARRAAISLVVRRGRVRVDLGSASRGRRARQGPRWVTSHSRGARASRRRGRRWLEPGTRVMGNWHRVERPSGHDETAHSDPLVQAPAARNDLLAGWRLCRGWTGWIGNERPGECGVHQRYRGDPCLAPASVTDSGASAPSSTARCRPTGVLVVVSGVGMAGGVVATRFPVSLRRAGSVVRVGVGCGSARGTGAGGGVGSGAGTRRCPAGGGGVVAARSPVCLWRCRWRRRSRRRSRPPTLDRRGCFRRWRSAGPWWPGRPAGRSSARRRPPRWTARIAAPRSSRCRC